MSWEMEENKSRHVDFQCIRSKSITNLSNVDGVENVNLTENREFIVDELNIEGINLQNSNEQPNNTPLMYDDAQREQQQREQQQREQQQAASNSVNSLTNSNSKTNSSNDN